MNEVIVSREQAESHLLASVFIDPNCFSEVKNIVRVEYFWSEWNKKIYQAMLNVKHPDQISVAQNMSQTGSLEDGMVSAMWLMIADCITSIDYIYYAEAVKKYAAQWYIDYYNKKGQPEKAKRVMDVLFQDKVGGIPVDSLEYPLAGCPKCQGDNWSMMPDASGYYCVTCEPEKGMSQNPSDY